MTAKKLATTNKKPSGRTLTIAGDPNQPEREMAKLVADTATRNALTSADYLTKIFGEIDLAESIVQLKGKIDATNAGDLRHAEAALVAQADALETIFTNLARRAGLNMGEYIGAAETYLRLALKAQSQCRATLETLATIKNPPVVFARQANIAHGAQQVNNSIVPPVVRAEETQIKHSELLECDNGKQWLDTGTARAASGTDPAMATVEAINRPANSRRKSQGTP